MGKDSRKQPEVSKVNLVFYDNNTMFTTSLVISEMFGKPHKDVLKAIKHLESTKISEDFIGRNFSLNKYTDIRGRKLPYYEITRDGFCILVMGFTGSKALAWKIKFLEAFNAMEQIINQRLGASYPFAIIKGNETEQICPESPQARLARMHIILKGFAAYWAFVDNIPLDIALSSLCSVLGHNKLEDIPLDQFTQACTYLTKVSHKQTNFSQPSDLIAKSREQELLDAMIRACRQFKITKHGVFESYFAKLTGQNIYNLAFATEHDLNKFLIIVAGLLYEIFQTAQGYNKAIESVKLQSEIC